MKAEEAGKEHWGNTDAKCRKQPSVLRAVGTEGRDGFFECSGSGEGLDRTGA